MLLTAHLLLYVADGQRKWQSNQRRSVLRVVRVVVMLAAETSAITTPSRLLLVLAGGITSLVASLLSILFSVSDVALDVRFALKLQSLLQLSVVLV